MALPVLAGLGIGGSILYLIKWLGLLSLASLVVKLLYILAVGSVAFFTFEFAIDGVASYASNHIDTLLSQLGSVFAPVTTTNANAFNILLGKLQITNSISVLFAAYAVRISLKFVKLPLAQ